MKQEEIIKEAEEYVDSWIRSKPALEPARGYLIRSFTDGANWAFNPLSKFMGHHETEIKGTEIVTMWIARDKNDELFLYSEKPRKNNSDWISGTVLTDLPIDMFPEVKWEDNEPTEVELVLKIRNE